MKSYSSILIVLFVLMLPIAYSLSASIGNARMIIRTTVEEGDITTIDRTIQVNNVNDVPVQITAQADSGLKDIVALPEPEFIIQPGESYQMPFILTLEYGGRYEGKILISFKPADDSRTSGVGLSSTIIILAEGPENPNPQVENDNQEDNGDQDVPPEDIENDADNNTSQSDEIENGVTIGGKGSDDKGESETSDKTDKVPSTEKKANPLIGIGIIAAILIIGGLAFYFVNKGR